MESSKQIDQKVASLKDWRGAEMARLRKLINEADRDLREEWKWGTPVWSNGGLVCALGAFRDHLKVNFFKGRLLKDPGRLLNSGLDAKETRAIDIREGDKVDARAFKGLVREASRLNAASQGHASRPNA